MSYQPNWSDPRVQKRTNQIITWIIKHIGADTRTLNSKILRSPQAFGDSELARYLRDLLLIKTNPQFKPGEFSQQYRVNDQALLKLQHQLGLPTEPLRHLKIEQRFQEQAQAIATGLFEYNDNGSRWYSGLQYIPREFKGPVWHQQGYDYDYDIECCAPTLLSQQAKKLNPQMKSLDYITFYLANKRLVRDELSIKYNLSGQQVKQLINGLFQGGVLNTYQHNKIFQNVFSNNYYHLKSVASDPFLKELVKDINYMWKKLRSDIDTGSGVRLTGRHKSEYYKQLERLVMTPVWNSMKKISVRFHREHDGFRSDRFVDPNELEQLVLTRTGFHVKFVWEKYKVDDSSVKDA